MPTTKVPASRMVDHNIGSYCFRNKIINGDMRIDQRNAGTINNLTANNYVTDRWGVGQSVATTYNVQQVNDAPAGFVKSARITLTNTRSPASGDIYCLVQRIEGQNTYDLAWGTTSAKTVTISFWVKVSTAGTYSARMSGGGVGFTYVYTFTVNNANTWEYKTVTIPGPTIGTWATDNTASIDFLFSLGTGSTRQTSSVNQWVTGDFHGAIGAVSFVTLTPGSTFQITGVQLEVGPTATPFEYRPIGTELALCQRYYFNQLIAGTASRIAGELNGTVIMPFNFPVPMRATPLTITATLNSGWVEGDIGAYTFPTSTFASGVGNSNMYVASRTSNTQSYAQMGLPSGVGTTPAWPYRVAARLQADAEL